MNPEQFDKSKKMVGREVTMLDLIEEVNQYKAQLFDIYQLCLDIEAHAELDCEVTINGNGTNPCEASNVSREILRILGMKVDKEVLNRKIEKIKKLYNMD